MSARPQSHPNCRGAEGHVCQRPSGQRCVDCGAPAGTLWGPHWCPDCDMTRLDRILIALHGLVHESDSSSPQADSAPCGEDAPSATSRDTAIAEGVPNFRLKPGDSESPSR